MNQINQQYVAQFVAQMNRERLSEIRIKSATNKVKQILGYTDTDIKDITKEEIDQIVLKLVGKYKKYWSIHSYVMAFRKFLRVLYDLDSFESLPKKWKNLAVPKTRAKYEKYKGLECVLPIEEHIKLVEKNAKNKEESFIYMLMLDSGCRPHEILRAKIGNIVKSTNENYYFIVPQNSKTGTRKVRLLFSLPYLKDYIKGKNPQNNLTTFYYEQLNKMIKRVSENKQRPYDLRHSSITFWANYLNEAQVCERHGTHELRHYIHLSGKDLDNTFNKLEGKERENEDEIRKLQPKMCFNCKEYNNYNEIKCKTCNATLDLNQKFREEKINQLAYKAGERLLQLNPEEFQRVAQTLGFELQNPTFF